MAKQGVNLVKATGTIGGLTLISRIAGFGREMLMSRVMGASWQADAFFIAFRLPNTFRRLFGEGAFSAGFVPLYAQRLQGPEGEEGAKKFSEEVLAVFAPTLILFTLFFQLIMPLFVAAISGYTGEKLALATFLTRITFPYLILISLVSLFSGILNSLSRFTAAAFAPALLNVAMLAALILDRRGGEGTATSLAIAVTLGGILQLGLLMLACARAGIVLKWQRPRVTPGVRQFVKVVVPATLAVIVAGLVGWAVTQDADDLVRALLGLLIGRSIYWVLWFIHSAGMGFGDVRLAALLGFTLAYLGWGEFAIGMYAGFLIFGLPGLALAIARWNRALLKTAFPFGPFMLVGSVLGVLVGPWAWDRLVGG